MNSVVAIGYLSDGLHGSIVLVGLNLVVFAFEGLVEVNDCLETANLLQVWIDACRG